jgi:hypothetical protein
VLGLHAPTSVSLTGSLGEAKTENAERGCSMKQAVLTSLEPWLLLRARRLSRELPAERRQRVAELSNAAALRARIARELREPELTPVALVLSREALALSVSALLAARGEQADEALSARDSGAVPEVAASEALRAFLESADPAFADRLEVPARRALLLELEAAHARLRCLYEPRPARSLALISALRVALSVAAVVLSILALFAVTARP